MRVLDEDRRKTMIVVRMHAQALLNLADQYDKIYSEHEQSPARTMSMLDYCWTVVLDTVIQLSKALKTLD